MRTIPAFLVLLIAAGAAPAATAMRASIEQLSEKADLVLRSRCISSTAMFTTDGRTIRTHVVLETLESIVGSAASRVTVVCRGGRVGDKALHVRGQPVFEPGEEVVVFIRKDRGGTLRVLGWSQGKFRVERDDNGKSATAVQDLTGLCFIRRNDGTAEQSLKPDRLPLADLLARVWKIRTPPPDDDDEAEPGEGNGEVTPPDGEKTDGEGSSGDR